MRVVTDGQGCGRRKVDVDIINEQSCADGRCSAGEGWGWARFWRWPQRGLARELLGGAGTEGARGGRYKGV